jgi:hypothetical protein
MYVSGSALVPYPQRNSRISSNGRSSQSPGHHKDHCTQYLHYRIVISYRPKCGIPASLFCHALVSRTPHVVGTHNFAYRLSVAGRRKSRSAHRRHIRILGMHSADRRRVIERLDPRSLNDQTLLEQIRCVLAPNALQCSHTFETLTCFE